MLERSREESLSTMVSPPHQPQHAFQSDSTTISSQEILSIIRRHVPEVEDVNDITMFTTVFTPRWVNPGACYERLEFLGDSVLSTTMSAYLYKRYPNEDEGFLSSVRSRIVCGASLSKLSAQHTPFGAFINRLTKNSDMSKALHARIMEDVFEAFLGAIFMDLGYDIAEKWIINFMETYVDFAAIIMSKTSAKSELCRLYITRFGYVPTFCIETSSSSESSVRCIVRNVENAIIGTGIGANKSEAENAAARATLSIIQ